MSRSIRRIQDARLKPYGLNLTEAHILAMVRALGPMPQVQLAQLYGVGRARAGSVIDHLQALGFVERMADPRDRRVRLIHTTADGVKMAEQVEDSSRRLQLECCGGLHEVEKGELTRMLAILEHNLAADDTTAAVR